VSARFIACLGALAIAAALVLPAAFGMDAEPLPEPAELTDAQVAAQTAQQEQECADKVGPGYIFFAREGHKDQNVCRDGSLK
jgi:hypothetical protein